MWTIYKYQNETEDLKDSEGYVIVERGTWYEIGSYNDLDTVKSIIEHEIYLYNCDCTEDTPQPRFKIESNFHKESE